MSLYLLLRMFQLIFKALCLMNLQLRALLTKLTKVRKMFGNSFLVFMLGNAIDEFYCCKNL